MQIKHNRNGIEGGQYGFAYLAKRHGISCLEARAVLEYSGASREKSTYFAKVLVALPKPAADNPCGRARTFRAWAKAPLI